MARNGTNECDSAIRAILIMADQTDNRRGRRRQAFEEGNVSKHSNGRE